MEADAVVIGAGVQGSAIALRLAQAGHRVTVLVRALEPALSDAACGAVFFPGEASLDPRPLAQALAIAAAKAGARFLTGLVKGIAVEDGRAAGVQHEKGRIDAGAVVLAAGSWSG